MNTSTSSSILPSKSSCILLVAMCVRWHSAYFGLRKELVCHAKDSQDFCVNMVKYIPELLYCTMQIYLRHSVYLLLLLYLMTPYQRMHSVIAGMFWLCDHASFAHIKMHATQKLMKHVTDWHGLGP